MTIRYFTCFVQPGNEGFIYYNSAVERFAGKHPAFAEEIMLLEAGMPPLHDTKFWCSNKFVIEGIGAVRAATIFSDNCDVYFCFPFSERSRILPE